MAILTIEHRRKRQAGVLKGRVLMGRWPQNTLSVDDRALSRIHAWIGLSGGKYYVADAGSRSGTFVNSVALRDRHFLFNGDEIQVGPLHLAFHSGDVIPLGCKTIDLSPRSSVELSDERGLFMDCACGAPLWVPRTFDSAARCRYCGQRVGKRAIKQLLETSLTSEKPAEPAIPVILPAQEESEFVALADDDFVPQTPLPLDLAPDEIVSSANGVEHAAAPDDVLAQPLYLKAAESLLPLLPVAPEETATSPVEIPAATPSPLLSRLPSASRSPAKEQICGVCHAPIADSDETTACSSCALAFHSDCWTENRGCSAYGCSQVGCLDTKDHASMESKL